jgi:hypothetical protein
MAAKHEEDAQIEKWLETPESKDKKADYVDSDYEQMRRTVSYVRRHLAQRPQGDATETHWRYSLMNWGHDPNAKS